MTRRTSIACVVAALATVTASVVVGAAPAGATTRTVGSQAAYRDALDDLSIDVSGPHTIVLSADITITGGTDPLYTGTTALTIDGNGHTLDGNGTRRILANQALAPLDIVDLHVVDGFTNDRGGAIFSTGPLTITDSTFEGNHAVGTGPTAGSGGAAFVTNGGLTVVRSEFTGNGADGLTGGGAGGALTAVGATPTSIAYSTFSANEADGDDGATGGALHAPTEAVDVLASTFADNTADGDGGLARGGALMGSTVEVVNSTLSGNVATGSVVTSEGGGVFAFAGVTLRHATMDLNAAGAGAAVAVEGAVTTFGSVLTSVAGGGECSSITPTVTLGYNWAADSTCDLDGTGDVEDGATSVVGDLGDHGGPTPTRVPTTPLIDAIPSDDCDPALVTDQRGRPRRSGTGCDVGSVEAGYGVDLLVRRGRQTAFLGDGVVNLTGEGQTLRTEKPRGYEAVFVLRIENDGEFDDTFRLRARRGSERFGVRYLSAGQDVTAAVLAGTFETPRLAPGQFRVVRARVLVREGTPRGVERVLPATATSVALASRQDRVKPIIAVH